jgi:hypothetical protein
MEAIKKEILLASYFEHQKAYKELALIYPLENPKRVRIQKEMNNISEQLKQG